MHSLSTPRSTSRFTQEDPIGLGGGLNLYGFGGGDPVNYSDPFGLLKCPPDCREITAQEGRNFAHEAIKLAHAYKDASTPYEFGGGGIKGSDCVHFCHDAATNAGLTLPLIPTSDFSSDPHYKAIPVGEAREGDVLWQPRDDAGNGHVGVYLGFKNKAGGLIGVEMGSSGASWKSVWGLPQSKGGWFRGGDQLTVYRPLVDKD